MLHCFNSLLGLFTDACRLYKQRKRKKKIARAVQFTRCVILNNYILTLNQVVIRYYFDCCVYVKRITLCDCNCFAFLLLVVFVPALSGMSGNSEKKIILQTNKQLLQYTVLEIHFRSLKYMVVTRIRKHFEQPSIPIQAIQGDSVDVNNPLQTVFKRVYTVYTYSNYMINQSLYC